MGKKIIDEQNQHHDCSFRKPNKNILDYIKLLNENRINYELQSSYGEAKKSYEKILNLIEKELNRHRQNIKIEMENELKIMENQQKSQFNDLDFTRSWDNFIGDYEETALLTLEKLKEKHQQELQQFLENLRKMQKIKYSKHFIELKFKEKMNLKQKKYTEAEIIKLRADEMETIEKQQQELQIEEKLEFKANAFKKQQQQIFQALLQRIQTDRNKQLQQRHEDSKKIISKNRNLRLDLINKHNIQMKKQIDSIREQILQQTQIKIVDSSVKKDQSLDRQSRNLQQKNQITDNKISLRNRNQIRSIYTNPLNYSFN